MTNITKAAQDALDRMDALINPANKLLAIPSHSATQLAAFADMATIRAALQDKAGEVPADFVPRLMAAVRIYQQQDYQAEEEASIADVAELYRAVCRIVGSAQPAPVVPERDVLTVNMLRHTSLTKTQARALIAHWLDGVVPDAALFKKSDTVVPDGFALVPVEPDEEWIYRVIRQIQPDGHVDSNAWFSEQETMMSFHAAMIAASQQKGGQ